MPVHIDQFETILSYMPECGYMPTASDRFEWFLPSVTETIYASAKTHCLTEQINGTLDWGNMVHLFNHTCFQQYPHFLTAEMADKKLTQNSVKLGYPMGSKPCVLHPDSNHTTEQCKKLRDLKTNQPNYTPSGKGKGRQKGKGKTKGKGNRSDKPTWKPGPNKGSNPKGKGRGRGRGTGTEVTCSHCHKSGHEARDCFTRKREMNQTTTNFSLTNTTQDETEIPIEFRNYVTFVKRPREEKRSHRLLARR